MIITAGQKGLSVISIPIRVNPELRPSRLIRSTLEYVVHSALAITRIILTHRPLWFFFRLGSIFLSLGLFLCLRYLYFMISGQGQGHVQSVVIAAFLLTIASLFLMLGVIADLAGINRKLMESLDLGLKDLGEFHITHSTQ